MKSFHLHFDLDPSAPEEGEAIHNMRRDTKKFGANQTLLNRIIIDQIGIFIANLPHLKEP